MFGYMFVDIIEKFPARGRTLLGILSGNESVVGFNHNIGINCQCRTVP